MDNSFNKILNEKYYLLQDIAKKYNYDEELLIMITYIYISFYYYYGNSCDSPIYDLFNRVKIISDYGNVGDISLKNGFGPLSNDCVAVTIFDPNFKVFDDESSKQKPQTIIVGSHVNDVLTTPILRLEMLTHEIRHALMGYYNTNKLLDKDTYYMRSGLQETYYSRNNRSKEQITTLIIGEIFDEITNTYLTESLVNKIMSFANYNIDNKRLKAYLNTLKTDQSDGRYKSISYTSEVKLLYPLLLNKKFINLVNSHQFDGNISIIKELIEKNTDLCDYLSFCQLLDDIYSCNKRYPSEVQNKNIDFIQKHINNIGKVKSIIFDINKNMMAEKR